MKGKTKGIAAALVALGVLGLTACGSQGHEDVAHCELPASGNIDRMFSAASEKLENNRCHYHFDAYRERLLAAAKGAPGPENEARFASLLRESIDSGVITKRQGQEIFSRYFDPEFYAVKSEPRSSCSALTRKDRMYSAMREELAYKREGMLEVLNDEERFRRAQRHYSNLSLVFDAVDVACNQAL